MGNLLTLSDYPEKHLRLKDVPVLLLQNAAAVLHTGKSFSEALILVSTNPQYDNRLFVELRVQYMKIASSEHVVYINCSECQNKTQFVYKICSELAIFKY